MPESIGIKSLRKRGSSSVGDPDLSVRLNKIQRDIYLKYDDIEWLEDSLEEIKDDSLSPSFLRLPAALLVGLIEIGLAAGIFFLMYDEYQWYAIAPAVLFGSVFFDMILIPRPLIKKRREKQIEKAKDYISKKIDVLLDEAKPLYSEIHALGIVSIEDVMSRTSARGLDREIVEDIILAHEVDEGRLERIDLNKKSIFKSLLLSEGDSVIERIEIRLD